MKILIIEDEIAAFEHLKKLVLEIAPEAEVLAHVESIEQGVLWLSEHTEPDLILSDIHLADGSSFLIFDQIPISCPIVFTTAYDEYALKAFKLNSIDYLLKPIDKADLRRALHKFKSQAISTDDRIRQALKALLHVQKSYKERFLVKTADRLLSIQAQDVCYFASEGKYVMLYHQDRKYLIDYSLEELETLLDPKLFFRLNRQVTAHIASIAKIYSHLNGKLKIELNPAYNEEVFVSRERATDFKAWLDGH